MKKYIFYFAEHTHTHTKIHTHTHTHTHTHQYSARFNERIETIWIWILRRLWADISYSFSSSLSTFLDKSGKVKFRSSQSILIIWLSLILCPLDNCLFHIKHTQVIKCVPMWVWKCVCFNIYIYIYIYIYIKHWLRERRPTIGTPYTTQMNTYLGLYINTL